MSLRPIDRAAHVARRSRLAALLADRPALIAAGAPSPRTYAANAFPFRATSHFLYLVGVPLPSAMLLLEGERATIFAHEPTAADALWHGAQPSFAELAALLGCELRSLDALPAALRDRSVATLPAIDLATCEQQSALLGRAVRPGTLAPVDEALADAMIALRLVHDESAIRSLRAAVATTTRGYVAGMRATLPGARESEVRAAMEREIIADGGAPAYGSIVSVHGEVLHNDTHHGVCAAGDLLLADVGAEGADGWASDVTRTWPVSGRFSPTQRAIYEVVLAANEAAIDAVRPGARYRDVHLVAARTIAAGLVGLGILRGEPQRLVEDGAHALFFPHGVGHLMGLDVHDLEDLGDRAGYAPGRTRSAQFGLSYLRLDRDLQPGMCVTIEPGFYVVPAILEEPALARLASEHVDREVLARFADVRGIRVEDDVLVTDAGAEVLTRAIPKTVSALEALFPA
jgi:Xaa-Pro aminopeptidase